MTSELISKIGMNQKVIYTKPYLIGISGGSGGGKTSVANLIHKSLGRENSLLFSMDTYYKDLTPEQEKDLANYNFDTPDALDLDLLYEHLNDLMNWKNIEMPTYDFATNKRLEKTIKLEPHKFIIFEGILAFHDKRMRNLMDLKLFIDLDDDIRLSRRIYRDIISRGRQMDTVLERYHKFVKTAYNNYIKPTKEYADIIIPRGGSNTLAIDLINYHLSFILGNYSFKNDKGEIVGDKKESIEKEQNKKKIWFIEELYSDDVIKGLKKEDVFESENDFCLIKEEEKDMFLDMFRNYLKTEKFEYFDLYMDIYTKKIKDEIQKDEVIILSNDELNKIKFIIEDKIKKSKNEKFQVFFYIPIFFAYEKYAEYFNYLKTVKEIENIKIVSVFANKEKYQIIEDNRFKFKAIYCGKKVSNYAQYMENYGFYNKTINIENVNNLISFSEDNFERRLLELIERDKKKDNLKIINNYQEDE